MEPTLLIDRMRRDHERVLRDVASLEGALTRAPRAKRGPSEAIARVLAMLELQFQTHMAAEDQILYPAIERTLSSSAATLEPLHGEHVELREMLGRLQATLREPPSADKDEQVAVQVHDMADLLRLHIRKEEALVFHVAARLLGPEEIAAVLKQMDASPRGGVELEPKSLTKKGSSR